MNCWFQLWLKLLFCNSLKASVHFSMLSKKIIWTVLPTRRVLCNKISVIEIYWNYFCHINTLFMPFAFCNLHFVAYDFSPQIWKIETFSVVLYSYFAGSLTWSICTSKSKYVYKFIKNWSKQRHVTPMTYLCLGRE